ncbi:hypothetical protein B0H14DRAFT_2769815, partial [Mycena olivaceomarginata]
LPPILDLGFCKLATSVLNFAFAACPWLYCVAESLLPTGTFLHRIFLWTVFNCRLLVAAACLITAYCWKLSVNLVSAVQKHSPLGPFSGLSAALLQRDPPAGLSVLAFALNCWNWKEINRQSEVSPGNVKTFCLAPTTSVEVGLLPGIP